MLKTGITLQSYFLGSIKMCWVETETIRTNECSKKILLFAFVFKKRKFHKFYCLTFLFFSCRTLGAFPSELYVFSGHGMQPS